MNTNQIVYLDVDVIFPHPGNPRKDLGDLSELAESIKSNGIMQNLTVIRQPWSVNDAKPIHYTVIIGHRRLAAAKAAGLKEVPCVIAKEMDEKRQLSTMLLENMQRSDLTLYEQAEGFQVMLDMGETVSGISKQTGFSDSTVRRRVKLLELDKGKLQKSISRGATLQDFAALEKIKDPDLRNEVLDTIGTSNFAYKLKQAQDSEKEAENKKILLEKLMSFATKIEGDDKKGLKYIRWISSSAHKDFEKPEDAGSRKYFFTESYGFELYAEPTEQDAADDAEKTNDTKQMHERREQLDKIAKRAYKLRFDFVKGLHGLKNKLPLIGELMLFSMTQTGYSNSFDLEELVDLMELQLPEDFDFDADEAFNVGLCSEFLAASPERALLLIAYANCGDASNNDYHNWRGEHNENKDLDQLYDCLEKLGYELSDEEKAYRCGTLDLFAYAEESEG